jgi:hypothetical protein
VGTAAGAGKQCAPAAFDRLVWAARSGELFPPADRANDQFTESYPVWNEGPLLARLLPVNGSGIAADAQPESREVPAASEFDSEGWS